MQSKVIKNNGKRYSIWNELLKNIGIFITLLYFLVNIYNYRGGSDVSTYLISEPIKYLNNFSFLYHDMDVFYLILLPFIKTIILALTIIFLVKFVSENNKENLLKNNKKSLILKISAYISLVIIYGVALWHIYIHGGCAFFAKDCYLIPDIIEIIVLSIIIIVSFFWLIIKYIIGGKNDMKKKFTQNWKFIGLAVIITFLLIFFLDNVTGFLFFVAVMLLFFLQFKKSTD